MLSKSIAKSLGAILATCSSCEADLKESICTLLPDAADIFQCPFCGTFTSFKDNTSEILNEIGLDEQLLDLIQVLKSRRIELLQKGKPLYTIEAKKGEITRQYEARNDSYCLVLEKELTEKGFTSERTLWKSIF